MPNADVAFIRRAAIALIVGATASAVGGIIVQAVVQSTTTVSDQRWSYPWSSRTLVPISLLWAALHVLVFVGLLGFRRSGLAGPGRLARAGTTLALAGTALLLAGELASIPIRDQHVDDTGATIVGAIFGLAVLLSAIGFLAAGVATLRAGLWHGWAALTPLITGVWTTVLLAAESVNALAAGVAGYGLCLLALGVGLFLRTSPARRGTVPLAPQGQGT